ncbi:MAG: DUF456 domain-containing protein [Ktedonobacteraceae bacterium]|nr:DUF456 domain-containing protein [Ktedonobacteraceae bacterium]
MQQDPNFSQRSSEDSFDPPQLPFPEMGRPAAPDALQPRSSFQQSVDDGHAPAQVPFPQPLPSTDTIDKEEIRFLHLLHTSVSEEADESAHISLEAPSLSTETDEIHQISQLPFPSESSMSEASFATQNPPPPQLSFPVAAAQSYSSINAGTGEQATLAVPGLIEVPFVSQPIPTQQYSQPAEQAQGNQQAKRAVINGVIALLVSLFTLSTIAGLAGLVIGAFAMIYGLSGLRLARRLPNRTGRGQALVGIALGFAACCIVITAFILRAPHSS